MDYWMNSIHAHTAKNTRDSVDNTTLSPPIFIVGTHRNSLHDAPELQAKLVSSILTCTLHKLFYISPAYDKSKDSAST